MGHLLGLIDSDLSIGRFDALHNGSFPPIRHVSVIALGLADCVTFPFQEPRDKPLHPRRRRNLQKSSSSGRRIRGRQLL